MKSVSSSIDSNGKFTVSGALPIVSEHGVELDAVTVRIVIPERYGDALVFPNVYLVDHDWWIRGKDSHIERDGRLCLFVPGEAPFDPREEDAFVQLLLCIHVFLHKEIMYQRRLALEDATGQAAAWLGTDRAHGLAGLQEAVDDAESFSPNSRCVCGSGKKAKHCHFRKGG